MIMLFILAMVLVVVLFKLGMLTVLVAVLKVLLQGLLFAQPREKSEWVANLL